MRAVWMRAFLVAGGALLAHGLVLWAQSTTPPGVYKSAASVAAAMKAGDLEGAGESLNIFPDKRLSGSDPNMLIRTRRASQPNNASMHPDVTEVYFIVDGAGTFVTGGTLPDPSDRAAGIKGGVASEVARGDFIILPPGTAHWFSKINGSVTYIETRFDAK